MTTLTTVVHVQQVVYDKAFESFVTLYQQPWMHVECTPPPKYEKMASPAGEGQRPEIHRLRSNSVPIAVSLMDCTAEEAGLIFSAAEKASARRRKAQSFDDSSKQSPKSESTVRNVDATLYEEDEEVEEYDPFRAQTPVPHDEVCLPPLPESDDSTPVVSPGIKNYNDDMVKFVKRRLQDIAHTYSSTSQHNQQSPQSDQEPVCSPSPQRPALRSHFSNWSTTSMSEDGPSEVELASSPAVMEDVVDDEADEMEIEKGYAHVVQLRHPGEIERSSSPSYFSWPARPKPKYLQKPVVFTTPATAELRTGGLVASTPPLINLDASQPDVTRLSKDAGFFDFDFDFGTSGDVKVAQSPLATSPIRLSHLYMGQQLSSPRPIRC